MKTIIITAACFTIFFLMFLGFTLAFLHEATEWEDQYEDQEHQDASSQDVRDNS